MKVYDDENKKILTSVTLFLTPEEATQLAHDAQDLAAHPEKHHHHINNFDYSSEITVAVVTPENLKQFDAESRAVIEQPSKSK